MKPCKVWAKTLATMEHASAFVQFCKDKGYLAYYLYMGKNKYRVYYHKLLGK